MELAKSHLFRQKRIVSYAEYFDTLTKEGAQIIDANEVDGGAVMIQAEDTTLKSSSSLSPNNDRTSVKTVPYDPTYIIYNTIGGSNWASVGQSMTWTVDAPKAGFYKIGMRFKQYLNPWIYFSALFNHQWRASICRGS